MQVSTGATAALPLLTRFEGRDLVPELETSWAEVACAEEGAFRRTAQRGTTILDAAVASARKKVPRYFWCARVLTPRHLRVYDRSDP